MRLLIAAIGRLRRGPEHELIGRYGDRLAPAALGLGPLGVIEISPSRHRDVGARRDQEAAALAGTIPQDAYLIAMRQDGASLDSDAFAKRLARHRDDGVRDLVFAIGGADGHGEHIQALARESLSLGPLTLPHALARVVLAEQLYRAMTILSGHPYHRE